MINFRKFDKIPRLSRDIIVTEKIDGTNACIYIGGKVDKAEEFLEFQKGINEKNSIYLREDGTFLTGSRTRWITPKKDNHGFARWVQEHKEDLLKLGVGFHYGEWWGQGINRNYGLKEKRFSLFNTSRWVKRHEGIYLNDLREQTNNDKLEYCPDCCHVVPILYQGMFDTRVIDKILWQLKGNGSYAEPNFMNQEGIVVYHTHANKYFKKTLENDECSKTEAYKEIKLNEKII